MAAQALKLKRHLEIHLSTAFGTDTGAGVLRLQFYGSALAPDGSEALLLMELAEVRAAYGNLRFC